MVQAEDVFDVEAEAQTDFQEHSDGHEEERHGDGVARPGDAADVFLRHEDAQNVIGGQGKDDPQHLAPSHGKAGPFLHPPRADKLEGDGGEHDGGDSAPEGFLKRNVLFPCIHQTD